MLARRFCAPAAAAVGAFAVRRNNSSQEHEDDRWLEAEINEHTKQMSNEERYALEKQRKVLAKMMGKVRGDAHDKVKQVEDKHAAEIADLKARLASLEQGK